MSTVKHKVYTFSSRVQDLKVRKYGVSVKYFTGEESKPHKRIDYEAIIKLQALPQGFLMSLDKRNIFFNQHEPNTVSEHFGTAVSQALYPVETIIDDRCRQTGGIVNQQQMIERWNQSKLKITEKYEGDVVDRFISVVDRKISSRSFVRRSMEHDLFWNLFFHPKYISYDHTYKKEMDMQLPIIPYKPAVMFSGVQEIKPWATDYGTGFIHFSSDEMQAPRELLPSEKVGDCMMQLNVDFDLDKTHHFAMHTRATLNLYEKRSRYQVKPVRQIRFTMYQLQGA